MTATLATLVAATLLLVSCVPHVPASAPLPPATPPLPSTPPPPEPPREIASSRVVGQVLDANGQPVAHAAVIVTTADSRCRSLDRSTGAVTDDRGEFLAIAEMGDDSAYEGCVIVEAHAGGVSGVSSSMAKFNVTSPPVPVSVRLDRAPPLDSIEAKQLVTIFAAVVNDPARHTMDLAPYVLHGPEALRVGLEQYRAVLGSVSGIRALPLEHHEPDRRRYELSGSTGRIARIDVYRDALTRLHGPLLDYGFRSERFVNAYLRAIAGGDAVRLAQVLNPDDIDFPVEKAREMILDYRRRFQDTATIRADFVDIDEERNVVTWRLRGEGTGGGQVTELIQLGFGDGLIGIRF